MTAEGAWRQGGCLCDAVRYRVRGEPVWCAGCTCRSCVLAAGAPYVAWVGFAPADFEMTGGPANHYRSSPGTRRSFCGACGTALFYRDDPDELPFDRAPDGDVFIATATLDEPDAFPPAEVTFWNEHVSWLDLGDDLRKTTPVDPSPAYLAFMKKRGIPHRK